MFFMYGKNHSPHWKNERKLELVKRIKEDTNIPFVPYNEPIHRENDVRFQGKPYLTMDRFEEGVYVSKVTNLSEEELNKLENQCGEIYEEVMYDEGETTENGRDK